MKNSNAKNQITKIEKINLQNTAISNDNINDYFLELCNLEKLQLKNDILSSLYLNKFTTFLIDDLKEKKSYKDLKSTIIKYWNKYYKNLGVSIRQIINKIEYGYFSPIMLSNDIKLTLSDLLSLKSIVEKLQFTDDEKIKLLKYISKNKDNFNKNVKIKPTIEYKNYINSIKSDNLKVKYDKLKIDFKNDKINDETFSKEVDNIKKIQSKLDKAIENNNNTVEKIKNDNKEELSNETLLINFLSKNKIDYTILNKLFNVEIDEKLYQSTII